jgi:hypothetical protein
MIGQPLDCRISTATLTRRRHSDHYSWYSSHRNLEFFVVLFQVRDDDRRNSSHIKCAASSLQSPLSRQLLLNALSGNVRPSEALTPQGDMGMRIRLV